ncbi:hypothetical protein CC1G_11731 [Coprinopsis cinerea okayama7|uniref:Uncharacterized protein n=1 Tax=Coprinopsis cinerea (strain Okayama-7 / 130 / ATCC MYA-4618 / FGSC 9003) TaxID=240176 RepID=A8NJY4_COPC7|nr:hypothetical protein CC1G_11731 [Coprinopsis cinerea okayama7\|eukprot:XP_001834322.2 hypothetical protein CC1G_11731 [Coprinopsis cinerea okayama7\
MQDDLAPIPWHPLLKAGRQLSSWFFSNPPRALPLPHAMCPPEQYSDSSPDYSPEGPVPMELDGAPSPTSQLHINALPVELLCEIFALYTHAFNDGNPVAPDEDTRTRRRRKRDTPRRFGRVSTHKNSSTNPIQLGHVCGYWRTLSLSMPILWSTIYVSSPNRSDIPIFATWIERSGSSPLHLKIAHSEGNCPGDAFSEIFHLAFNQQHRWAHIAMCLGAGAEDPLRALQEESSFPAFPALKSVDIHLKDWTPAGTSRLHAWLGTAPNLQKVLLRNLWSINHMLSSYPWDRLVDVELAYLDSTQLGDVLSTCRNISSLAIHDIVGPLESLSEPITFPQLHRLMIGGAGGADISVLLDHLELPSLKCLQLPRGFGFDYQPEQASQRLLQLLHRSECKLESLLISRLDEDFVTDLLASQPMNGLKHLTVHSKTSGSILKALSSPSRFLPGLSHLVLTNLDSHEGELLEMVQSRAANLADAKFHHVEVAFIKSSHSVPYEIHWSQCYPSNSSVV